jgi:pimeloyl-ACP methyl ester carboxylesterase
VTAPTLVLSGGKSPAWMRNAAKELADVLPNARHHSLKGQTHMVKAKVLAPALHEFFSERQESRPPADTRSVPVAP